MNIENQHDGQNYESLGRFHLVAGLPQVYRKTDPTSDMGNKQPDGALPSICIIDTTHHYLLYARN